MNVLAVDTSGPGASVAIDLAGVAGPLCVAATPRAHASDVLALVEDALREAGMTLADIDRYAFGRGPGGLTGLRVAASVVQGFAWVFERPVVAVSNLRAAAHQLGQRAPGADGVLICHDAGMGQVLSGLFTAAARPLGEEMLTAAGEMVFRPGRWRAGGSGLSLVQDAGLPADVQLDIEGPVGPLAADIARLAGAADAKTGPALSAQPVYWRHPVTG